MRTSGKKHAVETLAVITVGFVILSILVLVFPHSRLDSEFSEEIQEHHNSFVDFMMKFISWFVYIWTSVGLVLLTALIIFLKKKYREGIFCLSTLLIGVVNYTIKILINRSRPSHDLVRVIVDVQHQSFPSGHVSFYILFFGFIAFLFYHKKWLAPRFRYTIITCCVGLILTVPISRIYLGAHWFTDVLGGFLLGNICLGCLLLLYLKDENTITLQSSNR